MDASNLTPEEFGFWKFELEQKLCKEHFYYFVRQAWPVVYPSDPFIDGWHVAAICYHVQSAIERTARSQHGDVADTIIINLPPGCGKSRFVSVLLSAWLWARDPSYGEWYASFGYGVLDRDAADARRLIESKWFKERFWGNNEIKLTDDQNQKRRYNNTAGGWRLAASIGSKIGFGEHPNLLAIDDPHDPEQALGEQRYLAIDAWDAKYSTRGVVRGVVKIVIAQRLGEGDLCGHILENEDDVVHCCIPMMYDPDRHCKTDIEYYDIDKSDESGNFVRVRGWEDPRKESGELMWPEGMGEEKVNKLKTRLRTSHMINAQLQQNPTSPEGDMFKEEYFSFVDAPPTHGVAIRAWDRAGTTGRSSDFTAGALWVYDGDFFYLCDMRRFKMERRERENMIMKIAQADSEVFSDYTILFEQAGNSDAKDAVEMMSAKFFDAGFRVRHEKVGNKSKPDRAEPLADLMAAGRVKIVKGNWNAKFTRELLAFPNGHNDDQVDAAAMGIKKAQKAVRFGKINRHLLLITPEEQKELDEQNEPKTDFGRYLGMTEPEEHHVLGVRWD